MASQEGLTRDAPRQARETFAAGGRSYGWEDHGLVGAVTSRDLPRRRMKAIAAVPRHGHQITALLDGDLRVR